MNKRNLFAELTEGFESFQPTDDRVRELEEILNWIDNLPIPTTSATTMARKLENIIVAMKEASQ